MVCIKLNNDYASSMPHVAHMLILCVYLLCKNTLFIFIYNEVFQSTLMCYIPKSLRKKKYIPLLDFIIFDVVMSYRN
jgi:hypothetical protein